jgi:hypothetical protein
MLVAPGWFLLPDSVTRCNCCWGPVGDQPGTTRATVKPSTAAAPACFRARPHESKVAPVVNTSSSSRTRNLSTRSPLRVAYAPRTDSPCSLRVSTSRAATGNGRRQHSHIGCFIGRIDARHDSQIGMRLAVSSGVAQIRQGAGNSTAVSVSMAVRNIKLSLASESGHSERYSTRVTKDRG